MYINTTQRQVVSVPLQHAESTDAQSDDVRKMNHFCTEIR